MEFRLAVFASVWHHPSPKKWNLQAWSSAHESLWGLNFPVSSHGPTMLWLLIKSVSHLRLQTVIDITLFCKSAVRAVVRPLGHLGHSKLNLDVFKKLVSLNHADLNHFTDKFLYTFTQHPYPSCFCTWISADI